jgi:protein-disulfide isomerase
MRKRVSSMLFMLFLISATAAIAGPAQKQPAKGAATAAAVATVYGQPVTQAELDEAVGTRLMRLRTEEYQIRRGALDQIISERVLAAEAQKRGISVEELLRIEVEAKVETVPRETLEGVYEAAKDRIGNADREEALRQIAEGMRRQKTNTRRMELTRQLMADAGVKILLDPPRAEVRAEGPSKGPQSAPITIVGFSDYECSFCGRALPTLQQLRDRYGDLVRVVYRDYVLPSHRNAPKAAEAAHCAGDQGKFWEMHDHLFANQRDLSPIAAIRYAGELKLDQAAFQQCIGSGKHEATWKAAQAEGELVGVRSTPTFFINGRMIVGAAPAETFISVVEEELARLGVKPPATRTAAK